MASTLKTTPAATFFALALAAMVQAAPTVTGVSGSIQQGGTVTITGSGFGVGKTTPLVWDDFEGQPVGTNLAGPTSPPPKAGTWQPNCGGGFYSKWDSAHAISGTKSLYARRDPAHQWLNFNVTGFPEATHYYQSFWVRYNTNNSNTGQMKLAQVHGTCGGKCHGATNRDYNPGIMTGSSSLKWWFTYIALETGDLRTQVNYPFNLEQDTWYHVQMILKQSAPGVADGVVIIRINARTVYDKNPTVTRMLKGQRWNLTEFSTGLTNFEGPSETWIDDVYFSDSWTRVEIGNNASYDASNMKFIQRANSWCDGSITVQFNRGTFTGGQTAYLFVADESGVVNSRGYPIVIAGGRNTQLH